MPAPAATPCSCCTARRPTTSRSATPTSSTPPSTMCGERTSSPIRPAPTAYGKRPPRTRRTCSISTIGTSAPIPAASREQSIRRPSCCVSPPLSIPVPTSTRRLPFFHRRGRRCRTTAPWLPCPTLGAAARLWQRGRGRRLAGHPGAAAHHARILDALHEPPEQVRWPLPPDSVAAELLADHFTVQSFRHSRPSSNWEASLVDPAALIPGMVPAWKERWLRHRAAWSGDLALSIDGVTQASSISSAGVSLAPRMSGWQEGVSFTGTVALPLLFGFRSLDWAVSQWGTGIPTICAPSWRSFSRRRRPGSRRGTGADCIPPASRSLGLYFPLRARLTPIPHTHHPQADSQGPRANSRNYGNPSRSNSQFLTSGAVTAPSVGTSASRRSPVRGSTHTPPGESAMKRRSSTARLPRGM